MQSSQGFSIAPFLLLLSREHLSGNEKARLVDLAPRSIDEWCDLRDAARRLHVLPFVFHHVVGLNLLTDDQISELGLKQLAIQSTALWLRVLAAQTNFQEKCLEPLNIKHVFLKGLTLSDFYSNPSLRTPRDIDVLINSEDFEAVLSLAKRHGYKVMLDPKRGVLAETKNEEKFASFFKPDLALVSPEGILIELHYGISRDFSGLRNDEIFSSGHVMSVEKKQFMTMNPTLHLLYLCSHHSHHLWDSLKWLADISAFQNYYHDNLEAITELAKKYGMDDVVEVSFAFEALTRLDTLDESVDPRALSLLKVSIERINNSSSLSEGARRAMNSFPFFLQSSPSFLSAVTRRARRSFQLDVADYHKLKLPYALRSLYFIPSIYRFFSRQFSKVLSK